MKQITFQIVLKILLVVMTPCKIIGAHVSNNIVSHSLVMNTINIFDSYWSFFDIFNSCTVHLYWITDFKVDHIESFIRYCIFSPISSCVLLQSRSLFKQHTPNSSVYITKFQTKIKLRYLSACTVLLPSIRNFEEESFVEFFSQLDFYASGINYVDSVFRMDPYFIICPAAVAYEQTIIKTKPVINLMYNPYILFMNLNKGQVYLACTPCLDSFFDVYTVTKTPIKLLHYSNLSLKNFTHLRIYNFFAAQIQMQPINHDYKNIWNSTIQCAYNERSLYSDTLVGLYSTTDCMKGHIAFSLNCTTSSCQHILLIILEYLQIPEVGEKIFPRFHTYSSGTQMYGFRYAIFVRKQESITNRNVLALLSPFQLNEWGLILVSFVTLLLLLNHVTPKKNWMLYLVSIFLDQDGNSKYKLGLANSFLIIGWIFATLVFRNLYTSSMYTYMTKTPNPTNVPQTFNQLLHNSSIPLLSDGQTGQQFTNVFLQSRKMNSTGAQYLRRIWMHTIYQYWWYFNGWNQLLLMAKGQLNSYDFVTCHSFTEAFYENQVLRKNISKYTSKNCLEGSRFALLYTTMPQHYYGGFGPHEYLSFYSKILFLLYGQYNLIENSETTIFSDIHIWFSENRNYLTEILSIKLGWLVDSGIYNFQTHYLVLKTQMKALNEFIKASNTTCSWSRFSLVNQLVSSQNTLRILSTVNNLQYLMSDGNLKHQHWTPAKSGDLNVVWIVYGVCITISVVSFMLRWVARNIMVEE